MKKMTLSKSKHTIFKKNPSKIAIAVAIIFGLFTNANCGAYSIGTSNDGRVANLDLMVLAIKTNPEVCGDCDGMTWSGISAGYSFKNERLSVLYTKGMVSLIQLVAGVGPEVNIDTFQEYGIKTKAMIGVFLFPISASLTPGYSLKDSKMKINFEISVGIGFLTPIFGNPALIW